MDCLNNYSQKRQKGKSLMKQNLIIVFVLVLSLIFFSSQSSIAKSKRFITFEARSGYFDAKSSEWNKIYNDVWGLPAGIRIGWRFYKQLELNAGLSYFSATGHGITKSGLRSEEKFKMELIPADISLLYRFSYSLDQFFVPYIGIGLDSVYFSEKNKSEGKSTDGFKTGHHEVIGLALLLDKLDRENARNLKREWGVENSFLVFEARYSGINSFGEKGLDLSGITYYIGLLFEF